MHRRAFHLTLAAALAPLGARAAPASREVDDRVREVAGRLMREHGIAGMAIGLVVRGGRRLFQFGFADPQRGRPVTGSTLFEIGSLSKTFTATLGGYAQARGALSLADRASRHLPALEGSSFDAITLLDLATYTAGGLPLQVPDDVQEGASMLAWYRGFRPKWPPGTQRLYSNASIGLFGHLAARSLGQPFDLLMERTLLPALGLRSTYLHVPPAAMDDYAWGFARDGRAVRVNPGLWDSEAYGVKTTAADMLRFLEVQMNPGQLDPALQRAIALTHTGVYRVGDMVQGLGWEMYRLPLPLDRLLAGHSDAMALQPHPVERIAQPAPLEGEVLVDKTGSTNGFGAYAAFVPGRATGVVLLANRNYPNAARVAAAQEILAAVT